MKVGLFIPCYINAIYPQVGVASYKLLKNLGAEEAGLTGTAYPTVVDAVQAAKKNCLPKDLIFVGGSSFIVADLLANRDTLDLH